VIFVEEHKDIANPLVVKG
jgi:hypothetical protein